MYLHVATQCKLRALHTLSLRECFSYYYSSKIICGPDIIVVSCVSSVVLPCVNLDTFNHNIVHAPHKGVVMTV